MFQRFALMLPLALLDGTTALGDEPAPTAVELGQAALLASVCTGCHAAGDAIPDLAGRSAVDIATQFKDYRTSGTDTAMHRMARGYSEDEIMLIASYLADNL